MSSYPDPVEACDAELAAEEPYTPRRLLYAVVLVAACAACAVLLS